MCFLTYNLTQIYTKFFILEDFSVLIIFTIPRKPELLHTFRIMF